MIDQLGPILVIAGIVLNAGWGMWQRHWTEKDRKQTAVELELERRGHADEIRDQLDARAAEIRLALDNQAQLVRIQLENHAELVFLRQQALEGKLHTVAADLIENTELTKAGMVRADEAFHEANNANAKLAKTNENVAVALRARNTLRAVHELRGESE